ncbi:MAG: hypothetical protein AAGJ84_03800, partial [Pseudomonadota bacterium]
KPGAAEQAVNQASEGFGDAAAQPLKDLNLRRDKIPEPLKQIRNPYSVDPSMSCREIADQVTILNDVLGRDFDIPPPDKKGMDERAADGASSAFLDAVSSGASGFIPYRGFVRTLTGANAHQRRVLKAYERGSHRRAYLKGLGQVKGCASPASPLPEPEIESKIVYR